MLHALGNLQKENSLSCRQQLFAARKCSLKPIFLTLKAPMLKVTASHPCNA